MLLRTMSHLLGQREETSVRFIPIYPGGLYDPKTGEVRPGTPLVERYYADVTSSDEFMLVQDRVFRKIFWAYDFFFE